MGDQSRDGRELYVFAGKAANSQFAGLAGALSLVYRLPGIVACLPQFSPMVFVPRKKHLKAEPLSLPLPSLKWIIPSIIKHPDR